MEKQKFIKDGKIGKEKWNWYMEIFGSFMTSYNWVNEKSSIVCLHNTITTLSGKIRV